MEPKKAASNLTKHGVSFEEGATVFKDPLGRIFDDTDHSVSEQREIIIGHSIKGRLLIVCFAATEESVRLFSARKASKREREDYEEDIES